MSTLTSDTVSDHNAKRQKAQSLSRILAKSLKRAFPHYLSQGPSYYSRECVVESLKGYREEVEQDAENDSIIEIPLFCVLVDICEMLKISEPALSYVLGPNLCRSYAEWVNSRPIIPGQDTFDQSHVLVVPAKEPIDEYAVF